MTYNCNIEKQDENMFIVHFPDMQNVTTYGKTPEDAKTRNIAAKKQIFIINL